MTVICRALYIGGRLGKKLGMTQMHKLHYLRKDELRNNGIHNES